MFEQFDGLTGLELKGFEVMAFVEALGFLMFTGLMVRVYVTVGFWLMQV